MKLCNLKNVVFSIYILGVILDHLTTNIGISVFGLKESNIFTRFLIENGLWVYIDIILFISFISLISLYSDKLTVKINRVILIFPFISGFMRVMTGMWNMIILLHS